MTLSKQQMDEFQRAIEKRRAALEQELDRDLAASDRARSDADEADAARDLAELHALEAAAARMADGSYGVCTACGADVGHERLLAAPHAARCIDCQRRHEKTHAGPHSSTL